MAYDIASIGGPGAMMPPAIQIYTEKEARFLPQQVIIKDSGYVIYSTGSSTAPNYIVNEDIQGNPITSILDVEDCVAVCQRVLGLKIQEIAKLLGVSRATLDLHRKGKVKDFTPYLKLASFVQQIEKKYTQDINKAMRSVLIERKTLIQHILANRGDLSKTMPYFDKASEKLSNITINKTKIVPDVAANRLSSIGKIG